MFWSFHYKIIISQKQAACYRNYGAAWTDLSAQKQLTCMCSQTLILRNWQLREVTELNSSAGYEKHPAHFIIMNKIWREQAKLRLQAINSSALEHETIRFRNKLQVSTGHIKCSPLNRAGYTSVRPPPETCVPFCWPWVTDWTPARRGFLTTAEYTTNATEPPVHLSPVFFTQTHQRRNHSLWMTVVKQQIKPCQSF